MTGVSSPEKASSSKKKSERKCATKDEYRQLSSIMGVMNNLRKQVCDMCTTCVSLYGHSSSKYSLMCDLVLRAPSVM